MIVERIVDCPNATQAGALAEFEGEFSYPLSADRSFRISHGDDYPLFFRAMGAGCSFVASDRGRVLGTLGMSICRLILPRRRPTPGRLHWRPENSSLRTRPIRALAVVACCDDVGWNTGQCGLWSRDGWNHGGSHRIHGPSRNSRISQVGKHPSSPFANLDLLEGRFRLLHRGSDARMCHVSAAQPGTRFARAESRRSAGKRRLFG